MFDFFKLFKGDSDKKDSVEKNDSEFSAEKSSFKVTEEKKDAAVCCQPVEEPVEESVQTQIDSKLEDALISVDLQVHTKEPEHDIILNADEPRQEVQNAPETSSQDGKHGSFFKFSFENLKKTIANTTQNLVENVVSVIEEEEEFDDFILDDMEELLIKADLGVNLASSVTDKLRKQTKIKPSVIKGFLKDEFTEILKSAGSTELNYKDGLNIILVTGVNGAGKTTLIAKLANNLKKSGKRVLLAAGDTFRAAAEEQLDIWAQRAAVDIVRKDGIDAAAVVFDAVKKAQNENYDYVIIDTAGRLQNKRNLMEELNKIKNVIDKTAPGCLTESILVMDANTGQNGLSQAKLFTEAVNLTSVALTKLDGSAKGGIIIAIAKEFGLPVKLIGVGEKIDDLKAFDTSDFINVLFEK